jgi:outer membrane protein assembly factor BamB
MDGGGGGGTGIAKRAVMISTRVIPVLRSFAMLSALAACVTTTQETAPPAAPVAKTFGKWPEPDNASRTGTTSALQSFTPPAQPKLGAVQLRPSWSAKVGQTNHRTTMALAGTRVVIGTHGASLDARDQPDDGVYVIDGTTGHTERFIPTPGTGDRDVNGIAIDGERLFFTTDNGSVVAATLDGRIVWVASLGGEVLAAPALVHIDGDSDIDVVVGDSSGRLVALDGKTGKVLWSRPCGIDPATHLGFEAAVAVGDLDGDGKNEILAGSTTGALGAFRARDGEPIWFQYAHAPLRASPILSDLDGDGRLEALVAWSDGTTTILDGMSGRALWRARIEQDDGSPSGLIASPVPLMGPRIGALVAPATRFGLEIGAVVQGEHLRAFRTNEGPATATPVVTKLDANGLPDAIFGTARGDIVAIDAIGGRALLGSVGGPVEASAMLGDVDGDGAFELLVASNDGRLTCFATGSKERPAIARFRGDSPHNTGVVEPVNLGWSFARNRDLAKPR